MAGLCNQRITLPIRQLRDLGLNLLVMVASLAFFFGLAEGLARLAGYTPYTAQADVFRQEFDRSERSATELFIPSALRMWDLRPGFIGHCPNWGKRRWMTVLINSQGRRDRPVSLDKPAGTYRIALLGDSVAFGHMVEAKDNFATQLEWNLNARSSSWRYEVLNFGVPGYGTWQEFSVLKEKALAYEPDLVILALVTNDLFDNNQAGKMDYLNMTRVQGVAKFLRERSAFYRFTREQVLSIEANAALGDPCANENRWTCWETTGQLLDQMVDITRRQGVRFVLVAFPLRSQIFEPMAAETGYQRIVADYARARGVSEIDLLRAFVDNRDQDLFLEGDDIHLSEVGHSITAIEMLEQLEVQGALPSQSIR